MSPFLQQAPPPRGSSASLNSITNSVTSLQTHRRVLDTLIHTHLYFSVPLPGPCTSETRTMAGEDSAVGKVLPYPEPVGGEVR